MGKDSLVLPTLYLFYIGGVGRKGLGTVAQTVCSSARFRIIKTTNLPQQINIAAIFTANDHE